MPGISIVKATVFTKIKGFCSQYKAVYDKLIELDDVPDTLIAKEQNKMVRQEVAYVGWADVYDIKYVLAQQYNAHGGALINWINPGTFDATLVNASPFVSLEGFTTDGASSYINTNYNTNTDRINYGLTECMMGLYSRTATQEAGVDMGAFKNHNSYVRIRDGSDDMHIKINTTNPNRTDGNTTAAGLAYWQRETGNIQRSYMNNVLKIDSNLSAATGYADGNIYIGCYNRADIGSPSAFVARQYSIAVIGANLDATERTASMNTTETYMDSNGKGVIP